MTTTVVTTTTMIFFHIFFRYNLHRVPRQRNYNYGSLNMNSTPPPLFIQYYIIVTTPKFQTELATSTRNPRHNTMCTIFQTDTYATNSGDTGQILRQYLSNTFVTPRVILRLFTNLGPLYTEVGAGLKINLIQNSLSSNSAQVPAQVSSSTNGNLVPIASNRS